MVTAAPEDASRNQILRRLPPEEFDGMLAAGETIGLERGATISVPRQRLTHVYFPLSGIVSLVAESITGETTEVGTIGNEGMAGLALFFGVDRMPLRAFQQVPGESHRVPADHFVQELQRSALLRTLLNRFAQALIVQIAQGAACNRRHPVEERCARWLLMTRDRVHSNELGLTQEFLAEMLGVRRPSVTVAAGALQKAGMIRYSHGKITIVDPRRLERAACECYGIVKAEYDRLLSQ